jgi:hypothetical protein
MPKFTYSAAKGIEQSSGSGFIVQNVPISRSVANSGTAYASGDYDSGTLSVTEEVIVINVAGAHTIALDNGSVVGEQKLIIIGTRDGSDLSIGGVTLSAPTEGSAHLLVWNGSAWKALS